jgi:mycothiol synthase
MVERPLLRVMRIIAGVWPGSCNLTAAVTEGKMPMTHGQMLPVPSPDVERASTPLTSESTAQVARLWAAARDADGVAPLSEQAMLSLQGAGRGVQHLLAYAGQRLAGYAQVQGEPGADPWGELVVAPDERRRGVGRALLDSAFTDVPALRVWAHGNLPAAQALARSAGLEVVRELHKMSRPLAAGDAAIPVALPPGFRARSFVPGRDEQAWLRVNASAFAHHPEQGRLTLDDLHERMDQPWFDPAGLILVTSDDAPDEAPDDVVGFHWTKVDPEQRSTIDPGRPAGEVYVVGVDPAYQGRGLGGPLTALGLAHLASLGLPEVVLYVDGDNQAAIRTYTATGFRSIMVDAMYSRAVHPGL